MGAFQKTPHMLDEWEDMSIQSLDGYTTVYSDRNDYIVDATDPSTTIVSVPNEEWNYLFDAKSGEKALLIQTDLYTVEMKKWWMLYLFHDWEKVTVSSFNTVARVAFVQKETQEQTSHTYVYPHMYFQFDTAIFTGKKELDSLRIAQLWEIWYFSENFWDIQVSQSSWEVSDWANIPFVRNEKSRLFIQKALKKMTEKHWVYAGKIQEIQSSSMTPFLAWWYIEKYFNFLYNPEKKSLYYKNTILNNTLKLLSDAEYDNKTIQTIKKDLETLKTLDWIWYEQMSSIIETIYFYSLHDFTEERQAIRSVLQSILFEGKGVEDNSQLDMLQYHMDLYNFVWEQSVYAFLQDNIYITKADVQDNMYEYYALFLRKMIE